MRGLMLGAAAIAAVGCVSDAEPEGALDVLRDVASTTKTDSSGPTRAPVRTLDAPNGEWRASAVENGTGCPRGTTQTTLRTDGKTFTTHFSAYEAEVDRNRALAAKDCQLTYKLSSSEKLSYAVEELSYGGYAFLDPDVAGELQSRFSFRDNPVPPLSTILRMVGPHDDTFTYEDKLAPEKLVWSPCGTEAELDVYSRILVRNSNPRRDGYMNMSVLLENYSQVRFALRWKTCSDSPAEPEPEARPASPGA